MKKEWNYLTKIAGTKPMIIQRVLIESEDIAIEGQFELPPLARLDIEDQVFVAVFVKSHGSIKEMERHFGVSYPTIKSRLNKIGDQLDFVDVESSIPDNATLDRLEKGEITVDEAIEILKGEKNNE